MPFKKFLSANNSIVVCPIYAHLGKWMPNPQRVAKLRVMRSPSLQINPSITQLISWCRPPSLRPLQCVNNQWQCRKPLILQTILKHASNEVVSTWHEVQVFHHLHPTLHLKPANVQACLVVPSSSLSGSQAWVTWDLESLHLAPQTELLDSDWVMAGHPNIMHRYG